MAITLVTLMIGAALFGPVMAPHDPFAITGGSLAPPSFGHPMGTDALGRDVLSGVLFGARTSMVVATAVSMIALVCGTGVGMLAGYRGGAVDDLLMRGTELFQVIPRFFFAVITVALLGPGLDRLIWVIGLTSWPMLARVVRGEVIATRDLDFIRAAVAIGGSPVRIARRHVLPHVLPTLIVAVCLLFGQAMLMEASLGFLGLGDPGVTSWGTLAAQAQGLLRVAWWLALFPGLAMALSVLGVNLLADAFAASQSPASHVGLSRR